MKNPILVDLLDYWERLRAGRIAPLRSEIDPTEIEDALEHAFILEHVATGNIRFRLAGMALCDLMGMEVRGMTPSAMIEPNDRNEFEAIIAGLFKAPEIIELELSCQRPAMPPLRAEMLLLPMKCDTGEIARILGALVTNGPIGPAPNRFALHSTKVTRIIAVENQQRTDLMPGFAEPPAGFAHQPKRPMNHSGKPYIRLVKSDDDPA